MESLSAWKCSSLKMPSYTQRPGRPFSTMSSCTRFPTAGSLSALQAKPLQLTALTPTPLTLHLNHPKHPRLPRLPRHPSHQKCQSPRDIPRTSHTVLVNPCPGGILHPAVTPHHTAISHPAVDLSLAATPPPPAILPPTVRPRSSKAWPPPLLPRLCYAGLEVAHRVPAQSRRRRGRLCTFVHHPPLHTLPSLLHRHPEQSTAQPAPGPSHHCPNRALTQPGIYTNAQTSII